MSVVSAPASASSAFLGIKRQCPHCKALVYDGGRAFITCPSCGKEFSAESVLRLKSSRQRIEVDSKRSAHDEAEDKDELPALEDGDLGNKGAEETLADENLHDSALEVEGLKRKKSDFADEFDAGADD